MTTILVQFEVPSVEDAEQVMERNAAMLEHITEEAKQHGAKHHSFYTDGQALLALDEWDSEVHFHEFFDTNEEIRAITEQAGVTGEPKIMVLTAMNAPGSF